MLLAEVLSALAPRNDAFYVDGTFGGGGYTAALLSAASCKVYAIDRDPEAVVRGRELTTLYAGRLELIEGRFGDMQQLLAARGVAFVHGVVLDLGVSSPQLDEPARGFSFRFDGPLDMRMDLAGPTAADLINSLPEQELADIIWRYGEERHSRRIARAVVAARQAAPITRTSELAALVRKVVRGAPDGLDPATRTFQALRIRVNDEIGELRRGLEAAERLLAPGGHLVVVSFHSLEDREAKFFLRTRSDMAARGSRHHPDGRLDGRQAHAPSFQLASRRAVRPGAAELRANPRSRSAHLRAAERTDAAPWPAAQP